MPLVYVPLRSVLNKRRWRLEPAAAGAILSADKSCREYILSVLGEWCKPFRVEIGELKSAFLCETGKNKGAFLCKNEGSKSAFLCKNGLNKSAFLVYNDIKAVIL